MTAEMEQRYRAQAELTFRAYRFIALPNREWRRTALRWVEEDEGKEVRQQLEQRILDMWPGPTQENEE